MQNAENEMMRSALMSQFSISETDPISMIDSSTDTLKDRFRENLFNHALSVEASVTTEQMVSIDFAAVSAATRLVTLASNVRGPTLRRHNRLAVAAKARYTRLKRQAKENYKRELDGIVQTTQQMLAREMSAIENTATLGYLNVVANIQVIIKYRKKYKYV